MDTLKALGKRIRGLRRERDITQAQLAEKCNLSNNFIALLERGKNAPSIDTLEKLAHAFGVSIAELFDFQGAGGRTKEQEKVLRRVVKIRSLKNLRLIGLITDYLAKN